MNSKKIEKIILSVVIGIMFIFMIAIFIRFGVRQILVKRLGVDNAFTKTILFDSQTMLSDVDEAKSSVEINWSKQYPFESAEDSFFYKTTNKLDQYMSICETITGNITVYTTKLLPGYYYITQVANEIDALFHHTNNEKHGDVYKMQNGYLTYVEEKVPDTDIYVLAEHVKNFYDFLSERNIPLLYINAGSKVCPIDRQLSDRAEEFSNENGDILMNYLDSFGIDNMDMRYEMIEQNIDWYNSYYMTDHHWKTETGLWCANMIAKKLNGYGFNYNPEYFDINNYNVLEYKNSFLGGEGRSVTMARTEVEDFCEPIPKFETNFTVSIPTRGIEKTGHFTESQIDIDALNEISDYKTSDFYSKQDAYSLCYARNDAYVEITNNIQTNNADKKILMLCDSFAWYTRMYLSCDVGNLLSIYPAAFDGSIEALVNEYQPDIVIVMYCERNIESLDENKDNHKSFFDFR